MDSISPFRAISSDILYDSYSPKGKFLAREVYNFISLGSTLRLVEKELKEKIDVCWGKFITALQNGRMKMAPGMIPSHNWSKLCSVDLYKLLNWLDGIPNFKTDAIALGWYPHMFEVDDVISTFAFKICYDPLSENYQYKLRQFKYRTSDLKPFKYRSSVYKPPLHRRPQKIISAYNKSHLAHASVSDHMIAINNRSEGINIYDTKISNKPIQKFKKTLLSSPIFCENIKPFFIGKNVYILFKTNENIYFLRQYNTKEHAQLAKQPYEPKPLSSLKIPLENVTHLFKNDSHIIFMDIQNKDEDQILSISLNEFLNNDHTKSPIMRSVIIPKLPGTYFISDNVIANFHENKLAYRLIELKREGTLLHEPSYLFDNYISISKVFCYQGKIYVVGNLMVYDDLDELETSLQSFDIFTHFGEINTSLPYQYNIHPDSFIEFKTSKDGLIYILFQIIPERKVGTVIMNYNCQRDNTKLSCTKLSWDDLTPNISEKPCLLQ